MRRESTHDRQNGRVPHGAPRWITAELIAETIAVWQPYYDQSLTVDDALEILLNVTELFDRMDDVDEAAVRGSRSRVFP